MVRAVFFHIFLAVFLHGAEKLFRDCLDSHAYMSRGLQYEDSAGHVAVV